MGDERLAVTGQSWMDKEFGSQQLEPHQAGWDWFSLQLNDGREAMLYVLRDTTGAVDFSRGTIGIGGRATPATWGRRRFPFASTGDVGESRRPTRSTPRGGRS